MQRQSCRLIDAENIKSLAEARSNAYKTKVMKEAEAYKIQQEIEADNTARMIKENAQARLKTAQSKTKALTRESQAEEKVSDKLEAVRRHTEKMALANALKNLSSNGKMILSGKSGKDVLEYYNKTLDLVSQR